jgi:2-oxoisovalerate dehydrogenase E2 component (dihydrolipoyl transacylase)
VKVGDAVKEEDIVGTVMTDKAAVEVSSPVSGKVVKLAGEPGDIIAVGAMLVIIDTAGTADEGRTTGTGAAAAVPVEESAPPEETPVQPGVATAAAEPAGTNVASARIVTSPAIRRIVRKDFDRYLKARATGATIAAPAVPSTRVKEIKIIGVRRIIAERMQSAKLEIPHFAYVEEIDITELESLRKHPQAPQHEEGWI